MSIQPPRSGINYGRLFREQTIGLVRRILSEVAEKGLPPEGNHFYITCVSQHSQAVIPEWLKNDYPDQLTIVLQHQFWDLEVTDTSMAVTLTFRNKAERLVIPFDAMTNFTDPLVGFALTLQPVDEGLDLAADAAPPARAPAAAEKKPLAEACPDLGDNVVRPTFGRK